MQRVLKGIIICNLLLLSHTIFANPIVTNNVRVIQNATPAQCTSSWSGTASMERNTIVSSGGQNNNIATPAIQSCTGCAIDPQSKDCVCDTCYSYTN